uniref:Uncharacterized protein n=1 Tax=Romanomermis culicivorax TaxID=13658 RepID=A0A915JSG1_ROMCU
MGMYHWRVDSGRPGKKNEINPAAYCKEKNVTMKSPSDNFIHISELCHKQKLRIELPIQTATRMTARAPKTCDTPKMMEKHRKLCCSSTKSYLSITRDIPRY